MVFAKITMNVSLEDETNALELLNNYLLDQFDDVLIQGLINDETQKCDDIVVNIISTFKDDIMVDLYKPEVINKKYVRSYGTLNVNDLVVIDKITYQVIKIKNEYNLYSFEEKSCFFENSFQSIKEIMERIDDFNYEIYKYV